MQLARLCNTKKHQHAAWSSGSSMGGACRVPRDLMGTHGGTGAGCCSHPQDVPQLGGTLAAPSLFNPCPAPAWAFCLWGVDTPQKPLAPTGGLHSISSPGKTVMWGAQPPPQEAGHQALPASLPRVLLVCPCCVTLKAIAVPGWPQQQRSTEANAKEMFIGGRWLSGGAQPGGQPSCRPPSTWRCRW